MVDEAVVLAAFTAVGYTPRELQVQAVIDILTAYENGKRYVFLDAPTGSGKSIIALVTRHIMACKAVIVTATNALAEQYERDNLNLSRGKEELGKGLMVVMGAGQYPCEARRELFKNDTAMADTCYRKSRFFYQLPTEPTACGTCRFSNTRKLKTVVDVSVTNYSYFIIDQLFLKLKSETAAYKPQLAIFDEAHLINEQFSQHYVIHYSIQRGCEFVADIRKLCGDGSNMEAGYSRSFEIINENIQRGSIGLKNHMKFVSMLRKFYVKMMEICEKKKNFTKIETEYDQLAAMGHKYHGLFCKIDDYEIFKYECVVDLNKAQETLSIQPVFIGEASQHLLQPQNLFMSATLNYDFMIKTMALPPELCELVRVGYAFKKDDKTIDFTRAKQKLNYSNMFSDKVIYQLRESIEELLAQHSTENGIVITTSFKMAEELSRSHTSSHAVLVHKQSEAAKEILLKFKQSTVPTVLYSPSLFEGVDFPGAISTFQILPKAPYLSLGSKRMFHISRKHRAVYLQMSITRMVQSFGRSTRHAGDRATTYILDKNAERLFSSRHNQWKEQFSTIVTAPAEREFNREKPRKTLLKHCRGKLLDPIERYGKWAYWHGADSGGWHSVPKKKRLNDVQPVD